MGPLANADAKYFKDDVAFWNEVMRHGTYDDFWKARNLRPHLKNIRPAVMTVGGWFDAENLFGALETYKHVEAHSPRAMNILVMGPWVHGGWNRRRRPVARADPLRRQDRGVLPRADRAAVLRVPLEGQGRTQASRGLGLPDGHEPVAPLRRLAAQAGPAQVALPRAPAGGWRLEPAAGRSAGAEAAAYDEYVSDPAKPVPFLNKIAIGMSPEYMVEDQRFAARRPDVLVYQTDVLEEDLTIAGPDPGRACTSPPRAPTRTGS